MRPDENCDTLLHQRGKLDLAGHSCDRQFTHNGKKSHIFMTYANRSCFFLRLGYDFNDAFCSVGAPAWACSSMESKGANIWMGVLHMEQSAWIEVFSDACPQSAHTTDKESAELGDCMAIGSTLRSTAGPEGQQRLD